MREELLVAIAELGADDYPQQGLADVMASAFAERIVEKRQMVSNVRAGTDLGILPAAEVDESVEVPRVDPTSAHGGAGKPRARFAVIAFTALLVLAGGAVAAWRLGLLTNPAKEPAPIAPAPPVVASPPPPSAAAIDAPSRIAVTFETIPPGAALTIDGEKRGTTPLDVQFDPAGARQIDIELAGYITATQQLTLDRDPHVVIPLAPVEAKPKPKPKAGRPSSRPPHDENPFQRFD